MSVPFTSLSPNNPVKDGDVQSLLKGIDVEVDPAHAADFHKLLAAFHECAEVVSQLPDYQPRADTARYPRINIHRPSKREQVLGQAWAHKFHIQGNPAGGALSGKRISLKDCICVAGVPQLLGTDVIPSWTPATDATVVTRVLDAGADILGTSTCENFCNSVSSFTSAQGTVENPFAPGYSAGGSTSGGAALVGAGLVDITLGADQGGSIRVPAAFCGCVGLKPTHGLVPFTGITSGDAVNDHVGPLARTVMEVAACLDAISGYDGIDDRSQGSPKHGSTTFAASLNAQTTNLVGFKVGILTEGFDNPAVDAAVKQAVLSAAHKFQTLGATVEEVSMPGHKLGPYLWTIQQRMAGGLNLMGHAAGRRGLYLTEFEQARLPWTSESFQRCFPATQNVIINSLYLTQKFPGLYSKASNLGRQVRDDYEKLLEEYDVLITPTTPIVAPRNGVRGASPLQAIEPSVGITTNTSVFDVTGQPAMSIPVGFAAAPDDPSVLLPVGMQIVGALWQDAKVLRAGHAWESNFNWKESVPGGKKGAKTRVSSS
ncbi:amidase [Coleophoma cylindrospora]|uniref:Amidase n=1 Tax=Coleophoma cylindrospora TaxID=1849047 RepID=A0A3D8RFR9_9HELO|nr:amidase [Coleophoma cylindrospora]